MSNKEERSYVIAIDTTLEYDNITDQEFSKIHESDDTYMDNRIRRSNVSRSQYEEILILIAASHFCDIISIQALKRRRRRSIKINLSQPQPCLSVHLSFNR